MAVAILALWGIAVAEQDLDEIDALTPLNRALSDAEVPGLWTSWKGSVE